MTNLVRIRLALLVQLVDGLGPDLKVLVRRELVLIDGSRLVLFLASGRLGLGGRLLLLLDVTRLLTLLQLRLGDHLAGGLIEVELGHRGCSVFGHNCGSGCVVFGKVKRPGGFLCEFSIKSACVSQLCECDDGESRLCE